MRDCKARPVTLAALASQPGIGEEALEAAAAGEGSQGPSGQPLRTFAQVLKENKFTEIQEMKLAKRREEEALARQRSEEKTARDEQARLKRESDKKQREEEKRMKEEQDRMAHNKAVADRKARLVELAALDKQVKEKNNQQVSFKLDNLEQVENQNIGDWAAAMDLEDKFAKPLLPRSQRVHSPLSPGLQPADKKLHSSPSPQSSRDSSSSRTRDDSLSGLPPVVRDPLHKSQ